MKSKLPAVQFGVSGPDGFPLCVMPAGASRAQPRLRLLSFRILARELIGGVTLTACILLFLFGCQDTEPRHAYHFGYDDNGRLITGNGTPFIPSTNENNHP